MTWDRNYGQREGDFWVEHAIQEIERTYGDTVRPKAKSLFKFGKNLDLDTAAAETVWETGGDETYVTTNAIDTVSSSSASDTAVTMYVEGHTVSGTGADAQYTFTTQTVALNGQSKVTLGTPLARVSRAYATSGTLVGDFYVFEDDTVTAGVPDTASKIHLGVYAATSGEPQSFKAATTFSNTDYFLVTSLILSVGKKTTATVDFTFEIRVPGDIFRPAFQTTLSGNQNTHQYNAKPYFLIPKNADVRVRAATSANNTEVDALFMGVLCEIAD
jgi:hypothetical protein